MSGMSISQQKKSSENENIWMDVSDPQRIANAITLEINFMAAQLFELQNNLSELILYKPKRVYKYLSKDYQRALEQRYGENILRNVILTQDFSFPSEDFTG